LFGEEDGMIALLTAVALAAGGDPGRVSDFDRIDTAGTRHTSAEWRGRSAVVLVFLGTDCPVSNGYAPELRRLAGVATRQGAAFYGVHSDPDVTAAQAAAHAREYGLDFPVLLDADQRLARQAGVTHMPHAVVLTPDGVIRYRGRIDDRYTAAGKRRDEPRVRDLEEALRAVAGGRPVAVAETKPFGCPLPRANGRR
jgi:peroxiredoxin